MRKFAAVFAAMIAFACAFAATATAGPYMGHAPTGTVQADNTYTKATTSYHRHTAIMLIHGGGLVFTGAFYLMTHEATWFNHRGFDVYDVDYRAGIPSLADVIAAYDRMRTMTSKPICVKGESSGGDLALLLTELRPTVACTITEGAVVDIPRMPASFIKNESLWIPGHLAAFSPDRYGAKIHHRVLMGASSFDPVVPPAAQMADMRQAAPRYVHTMLLTGSPYPSGYQSNYTHASVTGQELTAWHNAEIRTLTAVR